MNKMFNMIFTEAISSLLIGGIPCVLVVVTQGVASLLEYINTLVPPDIVTHYFAVLTLLYIGIWAIEKFFLQTGEVSISLLRKLRLITFNVGFTLTGIYRVITGAMLVILAPILYVEPVKSNFLLVSSGYYIAAACLFMCCVLSAIQDETRKRDKLFEV